jgi:hypothetical protein
MRALTPALLLALAAAAPAAADYRRLPGKIDWFTLGGGELFTAAGGKLPAQTPDGRTLAFEVGECVFTGPAELAAPNTAGC